MTASEPVRVLLVEDNEVYRSSVELLLGLQHGIEIVAAVGTGKEATALLAETSVDVALVDFRLPGTDGAALARDIRATAPRTAIVCLTAEASPEERASVLGAGAVSIVEKGGPIDTLVDSIRAAAADDHG